MVEVQTEQATHQIRTSARRSFRGCRRRWDWAYVQGYAPLEEPVPLEFGRAFHVAMETIYDPRRWDITNPSQKLLAAKDAFIFECEIQRAAYMEAMGIKRLDREQRDDYDERIKLGCGMLDYFISNVHGKADYWFRPVKVEVEFDVPITNRFGVVLRCYNSPACGQAHPNGVEVTHGGRVDIIVEDIIYGGYWAGDWKTAKDLRATQDMLEFDDQICTYCWALRHKLQIDIRGFFYFEIRKAFPEPPKRLSRVTKGCAFSQDKRMPTTAEIYEATVAEHDSSAYMNGFYDPFLEWLNTSKDAAKFHQYFKIPKTDTELKNIGINVAEEAADMVDNGLRIYPSVGRFSCPSCAYKAPCQSRFNDSDYQYTLDTMYRKVK